MTGRGARATFAREGGGHRWQHVPATERHGRVHTSTVTVAVLPEPEAVALDLREADLEWRTTKGSGAGGQKRNKTESAVVLTHVPTGTTVRCENERSQTQNKATALAILRARLLDARGAQLAGARAADRRKMVGSGQRGDKIRTLQEQNDVVVDHATGRRCRARDYLREGLDALERS